MLILVRHGRTIANASGLLQGRVDHGLDPVGRAQAAAIASAVGRVDRIVSSPLRRARQTAEALAQLQGGVSVEIDDRWIELDYGEWDELPVRKVGSETWATWRADASFTPPGGESLVLLQDRVDEACADLAASAETALATDPAGAGEVVAVFTHVSPIKAAIAWALGVGPSISWRMNVAQAAISRIRLAGAAPSLISFNEVTHLAGVEDIPGVG